MVASDAEHDRACQRRRDELPGGHAGGARDHQFEPPRQREIAGHRADQDAERHQLFEQLRHAEQRRLRDRDRGRRHQARGLADHLDVVDQHQQHENARKHADRRDQEAAGKISPERVGHHAHAVAGRPNSRARRAFDLLMASISAGRRLHHDAADDHPQADADRGEQHRILDQGDGRRFHRHDRAGESRHAQAEHRQDRAADRKIAALARGARRAEKGKGQDREGEGIDRRHEAVMQFGAELSGQLLEDRIVLRGRNQLPEIAFANSERDVAAAIGEFRHVEGIAAERHQRRIALSGLETFEIAVFEHQIGAALVLQHRAVVGDDGDALLRIAAIVDEDAGRARRRAAVRGSGSSGSGRAGRSVRAAGCWSARRR